MGMQAPNWEEGDSYNQLLLLQKKKKKKKRDDPMGRHVRAHAALGDYEPGPRYVSKFSDIPDAQYKDIVGREKEGEKKYRLVTLGPDFCSHYSSHRHAIRSEQARPVGVPV